MSIGLRLKAERERLQMTLPQFAAAADARKNTVIDWQNDKSSPSAMKLAGLARAGVDVFFVLIGRRSIDRAGLSEDDRKLFVHVVDVLWSLSADGRNQVRNFIDGVHLAEVQAGKTRGVRQAPDAAEQRAVAAQSTTLDKTKR